jgi:predicted ester cyclase
MAADQNMATMQRMLGAINDRSFASVAPELIAPGFARHDLASLWVGVEEASGVTDFLTMLIRAMPDFHLTIEKSFANDDHAALVLRCTGTHTGEPLIDVPATGKPVELVTINLYRFEEGKIAESWQMPDAAGLMRQVGLIG